MNQLPRGTSQTGCGKIRTHFLTIARDRWGWNISIPVHEGCCEYDLSPRCRVCRFQELAQIGAAPTVHLKRARDQARLWTHHPPALSIVLDWKPIAILTLALWWSELAEKPTRRGGRQGGAAAGLLMKIHQKVHQNVIFWGHVRGSKRFGRCFCRNRYI